MPGYGFSGPTSEPGWDVQRVAEAEIELMRRLGHERYGAQGGDWGAIVSAQIGRLDPEHCAGIHLNMVAGLPQDTEGLTDLEQRWVDEVKGFQQNEAGYQEIQGTKPQTLAYGLTDSPAGLAAWIVEKFRTWSDCGGDVEKRFTKDELLANITLYWVTGTINSSTRLYCEMRRSRRYGFTQGRVEVPTGCAIFPREIYKVPRKWAETHYDVTHWTLMPRGGHFASMEEPQLFVDDVRAFFRTVR
jgi:microsomal epoxide hydrolase